jgi:hypothetical protein
LKRGRRREVYRSPKGRRVNGNGAKTCWIHRISERRTSLLPHGLPILNLPPPPSLDHKPSPRWFLLFPTRILKNRVVFCLWASLSAFLLEKLIPNRPSTSDPVYHHVYPSILVDSSAVHPLGLSREACDLLLPADRLNGTCRARHSSPAPPGSR